MHLVGRDDGGRGPGEQIISLARLVRVSVDDYLTRALVVFVTCKPHGFPHLDPEALKAEYGDAAAELRPRLDALVGEMMGMPMPGADLGAGTRAAEAIMRARHPELGPEAIAALGFYFSYSWR